MLSYIDSNVNYENRQNIKNWRKQANIEILMKTGKTWWLELSQSLLSVSCIQSVVTSSTGRRPLTKPKCGSFTQIYWHIWPSFLIHWLWPEKNFKCVYNWWKSKPCSIPASSKKLPASVQCPVLSSFNELAVFDKFSLRRGSLPQSKWIWHWEGKPTTSKWQESKSTNENHHKP